MQDTSHRDRWVEEVFMPLFIASAETAEHTVVLEEEVEGLEPAAIVRERFLRRGAVPWHATLAEAEAACRLLNSRGEGRYSVRPGFIVVPLDAWS